MTDDSGGDPHVPTPNHVMYSPGGVRDLMEAKRYAHDEETLDKLEKMVRRMLYACVPIDEILSWLFNPVPELALQIPAEIAHRLSIKLLGYAVDKWLYPKAGLPDLPVAPLAPVASLSEFRNRRAQQLGA